jgi:uncharacterized protein YndB with AHSA1/START domain
MSDSDTYTVQRSTTVQAPPGRLFEQVEDFHRWPAWSPWEGLDPAIQRTFGGPVKGVGSTYAWSGNRKAGQGRMEIIDTDEPTRVVVALDFLKPFKSSSVATFTFAPEGDGTRVTWTMAGPRTLCLKIMGLFTSMDRLVGKDFENGLARLKTIAEQGS